MSDDVKLIDVGANEADGNLRAWLAAEGKRQGELRLIQQEKSIAAMEARASSILTWSVGAALGLVGFMARGDLAHAIALAAAAPLSVAAGWSIWALWTKSWHPPGFDIETMREWQARWMFHNELQFNEASAQAHAVAIANNDAAARQFARKLRLAWSAFILSPVAALLAFGFHLLDVIRVGSVGG